MNRRRSKYARRPAWRAIAAAALLGAPMLAPAQTTSVNGKIAYESCGPSSIPFGPMQCDIWVMDPDGTNQVNLTSTPDRNEIVPAWSPDGSRIAYLDGFTYPTTLMIMNGDGSGSTAVAPVDSMAPMSWSPAGTHIAMSIGGSIGIIDLVTGTQTIISQPVQFGEVQIMVTEFEPAWSPDGQKIAFTGLRPEAFPNPITGDTEQGTQHEIVVVDADGSNAVIVSAGDPGSDRATFLEEDRSPTWSPDGSMLAFMSQSQVPSCCGPWQIWVVSRDGTGATNLTSDDTVNDMFPSWSPDGAQIVFSRADAGGWDLYAMPAPSQQAAPAAALAATTFTAAASAATRLTVGANASNPDWGRAAEPGSSEHRLSVVVVKQPGAEGSVHSKPRGIRCGADCEETYASGTVVVLTATAKKGSRFAGWSGECTGHGGRCTVTMDAAASVTATFERERRKK